MEEEQIGASQADDSSEQASEDVQQALDLVKQLRDENSQLASNFDNLKGLHIHLVASHQQLEKSYRALQKERVQVERQYQQLCESWKLELEDKQKQFEQARSQILQPRDLDVLRIQLLEEVEEPFRTKCDLITKEAEATQAQYVKLRRDYESLQNNLVSMESQHAGEMQLIQAEAAAIEQGLRERLKLLEGEQGRAAILEQQLRAAKRAQEDAELHVRDLRAEAEELRQAKEAAVVEREQAAVKGERRAKQLQLEVLQLQGLAENLTRKCRHLQGELGEANRAAGAAHSKLMSLQAANTSINNQLSDMQAGAARERQLLTDRLAAAEEGWEAKFNDLHKQLLQKDQAIANAVLSEREAVKQSEQEGTEALEAAQSEAAEKLQVAMTRQAELTTRLEAAEAAAADWQRKAIEIQNQARLEVTAARQEALETAMELGSSQKLSTRLQQQLDDALAQQHTLRSSLQRLELTAEPDQEMQLKAQDKACALEEHSQQLEQQVAKLKQQLQAVQAAADEQGQRLEWQLAAAQQEWAEERQGLVQKHREKRSKVQQAAKEQISGLRSKVKELKASNAGLMSETSALRISLHEREAELAAISRLTERPSTASTRSPGPWSPALLRLSSQQRPWQLPSGALATAAGGNGIGSPLPGTVSAAEMGASRSLEAAFADVRQRQEQYLRAVSSTPAALRL